MANGMASGMATGLARGLAISVGWIGMDILPRGAQAGRFVFFPPGYARDRRAGQFKGASLG